MTRTRRIYNRKRIYNRTISYSDGAYHPYKELCMGHCPSCKRQLIENERQRRRLQARHIELEIGFAFS